MPPVLLVDGVIGEETKAANKQLMDDFSNKWCRAYSATCGYVCAQLSLNLVRALGLLVRAKTFSAIGGDCRCKK